MRVFQPLVTRVRSVLTGRYRLQVGVLLVCYVASGVVVVVALAQSPGASLLDDSWLRVGAVVLGAVAAATALHILHRLVSRWLARRPEREVGPRARGAWFLRVGIGVYVLVAGAILILAVSLDSVALAVAGTWVAGAALAVATASLRDALEREQRTYELGRRASNDHLPCQAGHQRADSCTCNSTEDGTGLAMWVTLDGLAFLIVATGLGLWLVEVDGVLVLAVLVILLTTALMSLGITYLCRRGSTPWCAFGLGVTGACAVAMAVLWAVRAPLGLFVPLLFLFMLGLVPLSRGLPQRIEAGSPAASTWRLWTFALAAAGLGSVAAMTLSSQDWMPTSALAVLVVVAIMAVAVVDETFQLDVVLLLGLALAFVLSSGISVAETPPSASPESRLVVFGDSYISGEGASRFFAGTNTVGAQECRRAPTSYAYILAQELGLGLDFYACSGATTAEVAGDDASEDTQLQQFLDAEESRGAGGDESPAIRAVLVSVGGNDAWFGTVGQACLGPGSCDVHRDVLLGNVGDIVERIEAVYTKIRSAVGESVPIVAMPYPLTLAETGCDTSVLLDSEHRFLFEFTDVLNDAVRVAALRAGVNWFEPGITAFDDHAICDLGSPSANPDSDGEHSAGTSGDLAVNVIDIQAKEGSLVDRMLPTNWLHGSAHPNELGHELIATELRDWLPAIDGNPDPQPEAEEGQPPPGQRVVSTRLLGIPRTVLVPIELRVPEELPDTTELVVLPTAVPYSLPAVQTGSFVHHSQPDGTWLRIWPAADNSQIQVPAWLEAQYDCDEDESPQVILWQDPDRAWHVTARDYCGASATEIPTGSLDIPDDLNVVPVPSDLPVSAAAEASELGSPYELQHVRTGTFVFFSQPNRDWSVVASPVGGSALAVPGWDRATQLDFDPEATPPRQVIIWQPKSQVWEIAVRDYCELNPLCPDSEAEIEAWSVNQFVRVVRQGAVPTVLVFLGAWFVAVDVVARRRSRDTIPNQERFEFM